MAGQVWRHGSVGCEEAEGPGGREREAQEALAEQMIDVLTPNESWEKPLRPGARRRAVDWAVTQKGYWHRRACALVGIDSRVYRRPPARSEDTGLRTRLKDLSSERRQFGYRRLHLLLRREGWSVNWKKLHRIYKEEGPRGRNGLI